jgi:hypothetical protein
MLKNRNFLYGFVTVLGIAFLIFFFPIPIIFSSIGQLVLWSKFFSPMWLLSSCFFSIVGIVFLTAGICGIRSRYFKTSQKLSTLQPYHVEEPRVKNFKLYGVIAVLGAVFLGMFFAILYWGEHSAEVRNVFMHTPLAGLLMFIVFLFGGTGFLTIGISGIARQYFKSNQSLFTVLIAISIPSLILMPVLYWWLSSLTIGF